jgi:transposase
MIDFDLFTRSKNYHEQRGLNCPQIARELGLDPRTVAYWLSQKKFRPRKSGRRPSKLDPFKDSILRMLETHPCTAAQILHKIREEGFDGGYTILTDYVRKIRSTYCFLAFFHLV